MEIMKNLTDRLQAAGELALEVVKVPYVAFEWAGTACAAAFLNESLPSLYEHSGTIARRIEKNYQTLTKK